MFQERDDTHGKDAYDMSKAKIAIMTDGISLPPAELKHAILMPVFAIPSSTGEPITVGDVDAFDPLELFLKLRKAPERVFTAAPTPINVRLALEAGLESKEAILVLSLAGWASATLRNIKKAVADMTEEQQKRIKVVDTGYVGAEAYIMAREALRCAEKGMDMEETIKRVHHVESRSYHTLVCSSKSMKALAASGRVPSLGDGSSIVDGQGFICGVHPPAMYGERRPNPGDPGLDKKQSMWKVATWTGVLDQCDPGAEAVDAMVDNAIAKIKEGMTEGQTVRDVLVTTVGRPDLSHRLAKKIQTAIPVVGTPTVADPSVLFAAFNVWGESNITYWVADADEDGASSTKTLTEEGSHVVTVASGAEATAAAPTEPSADASADAGAATE